jgi:hypothetical protein
MSTLTPVIVAVAGIAKPKLVALSVCEIALLAIVPVALVPPPTPFIPAGRLPQAAPAPELVAVAGKLGPAVIAADAGHPDAVSEAEAPAQIVAGDKVGGVAFVKITSSVTAVQGGFVTVHLNVALVPAGTPVTVEVGEDGVVIVAVPLTTVHVPVPAAGAVAASVKLLVPQRV